MEFAKSPVPIRADADGVTFEVKVVPGASRTAVSGVFDGALRVAISAPPVDGKANQCLVRFIAGELSIKRTAVEIIRGQTQSRKTLRVSGVSASVAAQWLNTVIEK